MKKQNIELFGIPGSGKSYYAKKMIDDDSKYLNVTTYLFSRYGSLKFKFFVHGRLSFLYERKITKKLILLFKPYLNNNNVFGFDVKLIIYIYQMIYLYHIKNLYQNKPKVLFFDEGIIHRLISIEAEFDVPHNIAVKAYHILDNDNVKYFFIDVPVQLAVERIRLRNRNITNMDFLNNLDLVRFLNKYHEICVSYFRDLKEVELIENY
ncbi:hypothetical protein [Limosilactobacillus mucosae]|uniref:hypothetical protein n=1 Tax=uncultured Limosilactobacillus sp. TaxID=2837629 RepID=UPI0025974CDF|nr:hypothetical protein [uncultured Limosilactobacillus sp.]